MDEAMGNADVSRIVMSCIANALWHGGVSRCMCMPSLGQEEALLRACNLKTNLKLAGCVRYVDACAG